MDEKTYKNVKHTIVQHKQKNKKQYDIDRQIDRQVGRQVGSQVGRQIDILNYTSKLYTSSILQLVELQNKTCTLSLYYFDEKSTFEAYFVKLNQNY